MSNTSNNKPKQVHEFSIPVHRSIIKRDLHLGIPFLPLLFLGFISIVIILGFEQYAFSVVTVISWFILRKITKEDEWLLDIVISSLLLPDEFR